ncbi:MAG: acyl--CoA ligase [Rhodospirillales bacterium]|nr:acyl--CoA ligase [Rhodospirillales bacterium]
MTAEGRNLGDVFAHHADSDRAAIIDLYDPDNPREASFRELIAGCDAVSNGLLMAGIQPGERIAILALNRLEYLEVLFGAMRAGCIPVMVNIKLPADTLNYILKDSGAKIAFVDPEFAKLCDGIDGLRVVTFGDQGPDRYEDFTVAGPDGSPDGSYETYIPERGDIAEQPYTSGSTGRPKGVLLDHAGQCWMIDQLVESRDLLPDDRSVISAPLYHKNALLAIKSALAAGGSIVLFARFDAKQYIRAIERYGLTMLTGVPTMYALVLQQQALLAETDLSSVRTCSMGSAPASESLLDNLAVTFPKAALNLNYGITEGGPILFSWKHPEGLPRPRYTVGYPLDGVEIRLVNGARENEGTLHVRSPGVTAGYHNLPQVSKDRLIDGWLDTSDILSRDNDGWYYFVGRADDMFVCAGENIYPGEVETLLERHPDIMQAVVVPAPNELKAHVPYAFVVARPEGQADEDAIKQFALEHGPVYAHPRRVIFVDELPLSGTNKIDRNALRDRAAEEAKSSGSA